MLEWMQNLAAPASKIQTPLFIAGVILLLLYDLLYQMLRDHIFEILRWEEFLQNITGPIDRQVMINLVDKLLYLAILSLALGALAYLINPSNWRKRR